MSLGGAVAGFVSGLAAGSLKPLDRVGNSARTLGKAERIAKVVRSGQQVRVRPQGVARLGSSLATDGGEDGDRDSPSEFLKLAEESSFAVEPK